jgi:hypothetical protein
MWENSKYFRMTSTGLNYFQIVLQNMLNSENLELGMFCPRSPFHLQRKLAYMQDKCRTEPYTLRETSTLPRSSHLFTDSSKTSLTAGSYADIQLTAGSHSKLFPVELSTAMALTVKRSLIRYAALLLSGG